MNILTDAEYRQLTEAEKNYWRGRCLEAEDQYRRSQAMLDALSKTVREIRDALFRVNSLSD